MEYYGITTGSEINSLAKVYSSKINFPIKKEQSELTTILYKSTKLTTFLIW